MQTAKTDQPLRILRLLCVFAGRTCGDVGNVVLRLISLLLRRHIYRTVTSRWLQDHEPSTEPIRVIYVCVCITVSFKIMYCIQSHLVWHMLFLHCCLISYWQPCTYSYIWTSPFDQLLSWLNTAMERKQCGLRSNGYNNLICVRTFYPGVYCRIFWSEDVVRTT